MTTVDAAWRILTRGGSLEVLRQSWPAPVERAGYPGSGYVLPAIHSQRHDRRWTDKRAGAALDDIVEAWRDGRASSLASLPGMRAFLARSYACQAGSRQYKLYVPVDQPNRPQGLVVMLHGWKQSPDAFARGTGMNAIAEGMACWSCIWRRPAATMRAPAGTDSAPVISAGDMGEPAMMRALVAEFEVDPPRVYVAGLSAGGAMAAVMGEAYPSSTPRSGSTRACPMARRAIWSRPSQRCARARRAIRCLTWRRGRAVRTIVFHGSADRTVHPANADRIIAAARARSEEGTVRRVEGHSSGGRAYIRTIALTRDGTAAAELWLIEGTGHAWSGGQAGGSYTDPAGPDASAEVARFFLNAAS